MTTTRPFAIERAPIAGRRYQAKPDVLTELEAVWRALRDVPREQLASIPDLINHLQRCAGRIPPIMARLEVVAPPPASALRTRLSPRLATDHAAIVEGVFGKPKRSARDQARFVTVAKGRRVRVIERGCPGQLRMDL